MVTLVASNLGGESVAGPELLTTLPVKASIEGEAASSITTTSVSLNAKINPNGADTTYQIQYGTTTSYGKTTAPAKAGAGRTPISVSQAISGLSPETTSTYHWRILATNAAGTTTSTDQTFVDDTTGPGLPDGRQYELVTPPQKNGALIDVLLGGGSGWKPRIAENGQDMIVPSIQCFAGAQSCTGVREREGEAYEFARTSQGWSTNPLAAPLKEFEFDTLWSADATQHATLFSAPTGPEQHDDFYIRNTQGQITQVGPLAEPALERAQDVKNMRNAFNATIATSDYTHILYSHGGGGKALWSLSGAPEPQESLYEYVGTGNTQPLPVGVSGERDSRSLISSCGTTPGAPLDAEPSSFGSLSEDGRVVFFTAKRCLAGGTGVNAGTAVPAETLYERIDGEVPGTGPESAHTVAVSAPTPASCTAGEECESAPAEDSAFEGASADGSRVFFTSPGQLSNNASRGEGQAGKGCGAATLGGCNLYESVCVAPCGMPAEAPVASGRELVDVSEGEGGKPVSGGPRVQGVMAISSDGSHVYFVARGVLSQEPNAQGQTAQDGADNLYVHVEGQPARFIATLPSADEGEFFTGTEFNGILEWSQGIKLANVSPDGRFLVFLSHGALTSDVTRAVGPAQVYRYDAGSGELIRVSVGEKGFNDNGNAGTTDASIVPAERGWELPVGAGRADPSMSHDGSFVFFESPVALVPGALDDDVTSVDIQGHKHFAENVYEFHGGGVSLISDGKDAHPQVGVNTPAVELLGSDGSGSNVFFATFDRLTGQDVDSQRDYYDAHICSGAEPCLSPVKAPSGCSEEGCQSPPSAPPALSRPSSLTFSGAGNLASPSSPMAVKPKPKPKAKSAKCKKGFVKEHNKCVRKPKSKKKAKKARRSRK